MPLPSTQPTNSKLFFINGSEIIGEAKQEVEKRIIG